MGTELSPPLSNVTYILQVTLTCDNISINDRCLNISGGTMEGSYCVVSGTAVRYNFSWVDITFRDITTHKILNTTNITLQMIGASPITKTTSNGTMIVRFLSRDNYSTLYDASGYHQGKTQVYLNKILRYDLTLYLQNASAQLVLLTVNDKFGDAVQNVEVTIQRWANNSWVTEQILMTDFNGQSEGYYTLSTVYYNHILEYENKTYFGNINDDKNKKLIYAEDVTNGITFIIDLYQTSLLKSYHETYDVDTNISFVNTSNVTGYFRFMWSHRDNDNVEGCLKVKKAATNTVVCDTCTNTSTGSIICNINLTGFYEDYDAKGYIKGFVVEDLYLRFGRPEGTPDWGLGGYAIAFFLVLISFFAFLKVPSISIYVGTASFLVLAMFGIIFQDISYTVLIGLLGVSFLVANIKSQSGVNA